MTRIALGLTRSRNRELLTALLSDYEVADIDETVPDDTALCIVDEQGLKQTQTTLTDWKDAQSAYAPVLLLAESSRRDPWDRYRDLLDGCLDEIQQIPISRQAIRSRVESLLARHRDSKELASERALVKKIFETSPIATTVLDTDGRIIRANGRAEEILGLTESDIAGRAYDDPEWRIFDRDGDPIPSSELPFARVLDTGEPVHDYVHGIERADGERVWLSINMAPIHDEAGDIEYLVAALNDITERLAREKRLEQQFDLFEKAQDIANVGAWEYDLRTDSGYWTDEAARIHGLTPDVEPTPELSFQYYHPEDRHEIQAAFERAIEDGASYDLELRLIDEDGDHRWVRTKGEPQRENGELRRVRGTIQDITEQKERERELERMTYAVDEAPIGVVLTDPSKEDNPLIYVNREFVRLTGYSQEEAIGRNCRFLQGENTDEGTVATIREAIDAAEPVSVELRNYRADGTEFWNRLTVAPVRDTDGAVRNYIGFQQDVTESVRDRRHIEKLGRYLRHNVRNEMNVILGFAKLLQAEEDPPVAEYAVSIERTAGKLLGNMETQRRITKILRGDPAIRAIDVIETLETVIEALREQYPEGDMSLSGPDSVTVQGTDQLSLALEELITNAIKHNDSTSPSVSIDVSRGSESVTITITDNGPGIPEMERKILTEGIKETPTYHSQGLGLWLTQLVVSQSDGTIHLHEDASRGTEISVVLRRDLTDRAR
jgi:PAS domain S-box-containing protein